MTPTAGDIQRFWSHVNKTDTCWLWAAGTRRGGYGRFWFACKSVVASRFSFEITHGRLKRGQQACHTCDNPQCVRPDHLYAGTQKRNIHDAIAKGRYTQHHLPKPPNPGEKNGNHKLTAAQVQEIRRRYRPGKAPVPSTVSLRGLAREYGVSKYAITYALGEGWRHVPKHSSTQTIPSPSS